MDITTRHSVVSTHEHVARVVAEDIRELVGAPPGAAVVIRVPGGGDWSNEDLGVSENLGGEQVIRVIWTTTEPPKDGGTFVHRKPADHTTKS